METAGLRAPSSRPRPGAPAACAPSFLPVSARSPPPSGLPLARLLPVPRALRPLLPARGARAPASTPAARLAHREQRRRGERAQAVRRLRSPTPNQRHTGSPHRGPPHVPVGRSVGRGPSPGPGAGLSPAEGGREADSSRARRGARWAGQAAWTERDPSQGPRVLSGGGAARTADPPLPAGEGPEVASRVAGPWEGGVELRGEETAARARPLRPSDRPARQEALWGGSDPSWYLGSGPCGCLWVLSLLRVGGRGGWERKEQNLQGRTRPQPPGQKVRVQGQPRLWARVAQPGPVHVSEPQWGGGVCECGPGPGQRLAPRGGLVSPPQGTVGGSSPQSRGRVP